MPDEDSHVKTSVWDSKVKFHCYGFKRKSVHSKKFLREEEVSIGPDLILLSDFCTWRDKAGSLADK